MNTFPKCPSPATALPFLLAALLLLHAPVSLAAGPGDLLVAPTRVVFEGRTRNAEITLVNLGEQAATYRISFVELRMDPKGGTREIAVADAEPGEFFASSLIRFSPRQVRLEPKVAQTVRLKLLATDALEPGEYRSHLLLRAVPESRVPAGAASDPQPATGVAVQLIAVYGVSIPVIVRHGATAAEARLSQLELLPASVAGGSPVLAFRIERGGNQSLFGDLIASFHPLQGKSIVIGKATGLAVYSPNPERQVRLLLQIPPAVRELRGDLRLTYQTPGQELLAAAELNLQ